MNHIINSTLPCGLVLGVFAFLILLEKRGRKVFSLISIPIFAVMAILRLIFGILFVVEKFDDMNTLGYSFGELLDHHGFAFLEFIAFVPLFVSAAFLVIYVLYDKFKKTTQIVAAVAIITLALVWFVAVYELVSTGMTKGQNIIEIYSNLFKEDLIKDILLFAGFAFIIGSLTGAMESEKD